VVTVEPETTKKDIEVSVFIFRCRPAISLAFALILAPFMFECCNGESQGITRMPATKVDGDH
jgi:hypothetical protein